MPPLPPTSMATRKRTRSTNVSENNVDHHQTSVLNISQTTASTTATVAPATVATPVNASPRLSHTANANAPPKRQRNNPPPLVPPRTSYSFRNRSLTPDPRHPPARYPSFNLPLSRSPSRPRYNLRPRRPQSQTRLPQVPTAPPTVTPRRARRPIPPINRTTPTPLVPNSTHLSTSIHTASSPLYATHASILPDIPSMILPTPPVIQPRQYRLVYISDDDEEIPMTAREPATLINTTINLVTDDEDDERRRPLPVQRRTSRSTSGAGFHIRSRTAGAIPSSAVSTSSSSSSSSSSSLTTINTQDFITGVAHVRLNRAIEIVIDSIQSLEGAVNNFDQLVFGLIYGRLGTRAEFESIEGMIRLSRILSLTVPPHLTPEEIDALPKITFAKKTSPTSSVFLIEKCPICLTEFDDQETINKLHCTHLFHLQCISTWLSENDSCPTCRRKVMGDSN